MSLDVIATGTQAPRVGLELPKGVRIRKWVQLLEEVLSEGGREVERPIRKVVVAAVMSNPYASRWSDDLSLLVDAGELLAGEMIERAQALLVSPVAAFGKGGVVGEHGELEHVAAVLHPKFGAPIRSGSDGIAILPSVKKLGGIGTTLDVPVHHKKAMMIRSHFDAIELRVPDAPRADELLVALGVTDGPRPHARVGGLSEADARGEDGIR